MLRTSCSILLAAVLLSAAPACTQSVASDGATTFGSPPGSGDDAGSGDPGASATDGGASGRGGPGAGTGAVSDAGIGGPATGPGAEAGGLGSWTTGAGDAGSDAAADSGALAVQTFDSSVGPITVAPGQETTVCITVRMPNPSAMYVPRITAELAPGSHHLVVYRSQATSESPTPTPCTAFQGVLNGSAVPMMIAQTAEADLTFPTGVALKVADNQMIMLEAHYINSGTTTLQGHGTVHFQSLPLTTPNVTESDFAFYGTTNIAIAPMSTGSVGPLFVSPQAGTHGFAVTTHEHRLGTRFRIWFANSASDTNHTPIADTTDWANAPLYQVNPPMDFNGSNGVAYKCEWNNTTNQLITFGESALQEMCFMWMYYYPSHGFDMRFQ